MFYLNPAVKEVCRLSKINEMCEGKRRISIAPKGTKPTKNDYRDIVGEFEKWELVSSHIGRRSFATNYYKKIPTPVLMTVTGHSKESLFLAYIGKKEDKDADAKLMMKYALIVEEERRKELEDRKKKQKVNMKQVHKKAN